MEDVKKEGTLDIWGEGVKNYCAKSKLSLLCYLDEMLPQAKTSEEKERLGRIKARIHNELSQLSLEVRILLTCMKSGGDISPFREEIVRKNGNHSSSRAVEIKRKFRDLPNPVLKKAEGEK